jgi:type IV pilus assembly protein PilE
MAMIVHVLRVRPVAIHSAAGRPPPLPNRGVTLLELLIAVMVVGIIAALAYPSFTGAIRKSRRADAMAALTQVMQAQERWRANNTTYSGSITSLAQETGAPTQSAPPPNERNGHYDISIISGSATSSGYTAVAQARSDSSQHADTNCRSLHVTMSGGGILSYTSTNASGTTNSPDICWVK